MAKNVVVNMYDISGDEIGFANTTLYKDPYVYCLSRTIIQRINLVSKLGEVYRAVDVGGGVVGDSYTTKGDYIYFIKYSEGSYYLSRIHLITLEVDDIYRLWSFSTSLSISDSVKASFNVDDSGVVYAIIDAYIKTTSYISDIPIQTNTYKYYRCYTIYNGDVTLIHSSSDGYNSLSIPRIHNDISRFVYGMTGNPLSPNFSQSSTKRVGFTETQVPSYLTLNNGSYLGGALFEYENYYWCVGGYLEGNPNTNIIRIDKLTLSSNLFSTIDINRTNEPLVALSADNAYVIIGRKLLVFSTEEYNIDYYLYNSLGEDSSTLNNLPVKKVRVSYDSSTINVNLTFIDNSDFDLYITEELNSSLLFAGLSTKPNAKRPTILLGENDIQLYSNTSFYPVVVKQLNPDTVFAVNLYKNSAEANRVDKTDYLTAVGSLNGVMREGSSITDLSITFEMDTLPQFNYVHIPAFNRYYFVNGIDTVKYRLWKMNLTVDPLMTYKDAILSCKAFIDRNEFEFNNYIVDKKLIVEQGVDVAVEEFGNDLFNITPTTDSDNYWWRYVINGYRISTGPAVEDN